MGDLVRVSAVLHFDQILLTNLLQVQNDIFLSWLIFMGFDLFHKLALGRDQLCLVSILGFSNTQLLLDLPEALFEVLNVLFVHDEGLGVDVLSDQPDMMLVLILVPARYHLNYLANVFHKLLILLLNRQTLFRGEASWKLAAIIFPPLIAQLYPLLLLFNNYQPLTPSNGSKAFSFSDFMLHSSVPVAIR